MWAPYGTVLAAYGPFYYHRNRRAAFAAVGSADAHRGQGLGAVRGRDHDRRTADGGRAAAGALLHRAARGASGPARPSRARRAGAHLLAEQARADERARLAGEMHDVVTHRVSLMVLQAGALGITATDEATRRAAEELRAAGCQALEELRDLVGILRTEPDGDQTPSISGLPALVAESTAVGTPAELSRGGRPRARLPGRRPHRLPDRARGADERAQARAGRPRACPGQLRRIAGLRGHHQRAGAARRGQRAGHAPAPASASRACGSASSSCTARCGPARPPTADSGWRPRLPSYVPTAEPTRPSSGDDGRGR